MLKNKIMSPVLAWVTINTCRPQQDDIASSVAGWILPFFVSSSERRSLSYIKKVCYYW